MAAPLTIIGWVIALGFFFVLLPVALLTYGHYRRRRVVRCPEADNLAEIALDARRAAFSAMLGRLVLRVRECTLWPGRKGCRQGCLRQVER